MTVKIIIILFLIAIVYCMLSGLYFLMRDPQTSRRLQKALIWRMALSLLLFALLIIGYFLGWLSPHPLGVGRW